MTGESTPTDVFIVGAGPTGLVLALWLTHQGVSVRIVDKTAAPGTTSRAMAVQARTLEFYTQVGLADTVVAAGMQNPAFNIWAGGKRRARIALAAAGAQISPYPYVLVHPQDRHEQTLIEALRKRGVEVERETEVVGFEEKGDIVEVRVKRANVGEGSESICRARYLAGCDGARSVVRHALGATFEGGTYPQVFYVADIKTASPTPLGEIHISLEVADFVLLMSYDDQGRARLIGAVRGERAERADAGELTFDDVGKEAIQGMGIQIEEVNWFSTYRVHHRVTNTYRRGRAFLLGDAAHVHSPAGGQGMNTGIGDSVNLAWKLAAVIKGTAPDSLLDSYEFERKAFAELLVATTDRVFTAVTSDSKLAGLVRHHIAPVVAPLAFKFDAVREEMFEIVSQTRVNYRGSPLSAGSVGEIHAGDRMPWVRVGSSDNFEPLKAMSWQVHVYGEAPAVVSAWCQKSGVPLHAFEWHDEFEKAGFERGAVYLVRPDMHVAMADSSGQAAGLSAYFEARGISVA